MFGLFRKPTINPIHQPRETQFQAPLKIFGIDPAMGIPGVSVETIMQTPEVQTKLERIRWLLNDIPQERKKELIDDVVEAFVRHVHLLPASQSYHHSESGGLLIHSLEVAFHATQNAYGGRTFGYNEGNSYRREVTPKFRYAAFLAGLFHDSGKPHADILHVRSEGKKWDVTETLTDWIDAIVGPKNTYRIEFLSERGFTHTDLTLREFWRILPKPAFDYLLIRPEPSIDGSLPSNELVAARNLVSAAFINVLSKKETNDNDIKVLNQIVITADSTSTEYYRSKSSDISTRICSAISHMIAKGRWVINDSQSPIIISKKDVFIRWQEGAYGIINYLKKMRSANDDMDADSVADILIERGIADPNYQASGKTVRYYNIEVTYENAAVTATYACLRIILLDQLFPGEVIDRITKSVEIKQIGEGFSGLSESVQSSLKEYQNNVEEENQDDDTGPVLLRQDAKSVEEEDAAEVREIGAQISTEIMEKDVDTLLPGPTGITGEIKNDNKSADIQKKTTESKLPIVEQIPEQKKAPEKAEEQNANKWYIDKGDAGIILKIIAKEYQSKTLKNVNDVVLEGKQVRINTDLFNTHGYSARDIVTTLADLDLIVFDNVEQNHVVPIMVSGKKLRCVRLNPAATRYFLMPVKQEMDKAQPNKQQKATTPKKEPSKPVSETKHAQKVDGTTRNSTSLDIDSTNIHEVIAADKPEIIDRLPKFSSKDKEIMLASKFMRAIYQNQNKPLPFKIVKTDTHLQFGLIESVAWFVNENTKDNLSEGLVTRSIRSNPEVFNEKDLVITIKNNHI